ncbi:hypothetical protein IG193_07605 [Infirmifilum lucidum]|uniref:Uncharacterized protein n=1 Tax=Infirmifilum lucidum TaxID=2776706 RepID=A0A7L9FI64_9CREN|nr:hypothetical protein [Infirmifilum lucidum]QOJ78614.1 hypothetical protein IG193_07605 [Infirmifilum lucidum]
MPPRPTPPILLLLLVASVSFALVVLTNIAVLTVVARQAPLTKYQGWDTGNLSYGVKGASATWATDSGLNATIVWLRIMTGQWFNATFNPALYGVPQIPVEAWLEYEAITGSYASCLNLTLHLNSTTQVVVVNGRVVQATGTAVSMPAGSRGLFNTLAGSSCYVPPGQEVARVYTWLAYRAGVASVKQRVVWVVVAGPTRVWLGDPSTTGVSVSLYDSNTRALSTATLTANLTRLQRGAIYYDTFDTNPFTAGRMSQLSCTWRYSSTGRYIYISTSSRPTTYGGECVAVANIDLSRYVSEGRRIYIAVVAWRPGYPLQIRAFYDTVFTDPLTQRIYTVGYWNYPQPGQTGDITDATAYYFDGTNWVQRASVQVAPPGLGFEYDYYHEIASVADFSAKTLEQWNRTRIYATPMGYLFSPSRAGVGFYLIDTGTTVQANFDNLVISVDNPAWEVKVVGLKPGWTARIRDSTGQTVVSGVAGSDGSVVLQLWPTITSYVNAFIVKSGYIDIIDEYGNIVISKQFTDDVVGGDVYRFSWGFAGRVLNVLSNLSASFTSKLVLAGTNCTVSGSAVSLYLYNSSGSASTPIQVSGPSVTSWATSTVSMSPPASWSGSWLAGYWYLSASLPGSASTCYLDVVEPVYLPDSVQVGLRAVLWLKRP